MSKSLLYAANTSLQELQTGDLVSFGQTVRRYGNNLGVYGGNIIEKGPGYYTHAANLNIVSGADGEVTIALFKNGVRIPGAFVTITTTSGRSYQAAIPFVTRESCCAEGTITAELVAGTANIASAAIWSERA